LVVNRFLLAYWMSFAALLHLCRFFGASPAPAEPVDLEDQQLSSWNRRRAVPRGGFSTMPPSQYSSPSISTRRTARRQRAARKHLLGADIGHLFAVE